MQNGRQNPKTPQRMARQISLLVVQVVICGLFLIAGIMKLTMPVSEISKIFPWTGQVPEVFLRSIALVDIAGGVGILLPSLTKIYPKLTVVAAMGCVLLQVAAIFFHAMRNELSSTPFNFVLLGLCVFVIRGRFSTLYGKTNSDW
jgi:uncharacterized membrane protein YphA (DoxX/SURF4 family)